jgi:hypothetical protein
LNSKNARNTNRVPHTFGEHHPNYTLPYTFARYYLLGARYRYLNYGHYLRWRLRQLQINSHNLSTIAQIGMSHGLFSKEVSDFPKNSLLLNNSDYEFLEEFSTTKGRSEIAEYHIASLLSLKPRQVFKRFYKLGIDLRNNSSFPAVKECLNMIGKGEESFAWLAKVGLCHGIFSEVYLEEREEKQCEILKELI